MTSYAYNFAFGVSGPINGRRVGLATKDEIKAYVAETGVRQVRYLLHYRYLTLRVATAPPMVFTVLPDRPGDGSVIDRSEYSRHRDWGAE